MDSSRGQNGNLSATFTTTVTVVARNRALPPIYLSKPDFLTMVSAGSPVISVLPLPELVYTTQTTAALAASTSVTDPDGDTIAQLLVQITGNCGGGDTLAAAVSGLGLSSSYTNSSCTLLITGTAAASVYSTAAGLITFTNAAHQPSTSARTVLWNATDTASAGGAGGPMFGTATSYISVVLVNCECLEHLQTTVAAVYPSTLFVQHRL
jgi:hypothetical protein